ncbi:LCP family protein [Paenibacillus protaetiae]|uniref:Cell envelope-related transcriptional attenuator domain-containing protein n=1 Tax=Paenibacillus protaetiae TaxID=2509456 RepID=A0A4P6EZE3_9BACL|nr:LCP family protein [Paenibacillus protaetiae]QAY68145.1 hypothetical protein ET464_18970 [Paenibacillus protaetiae]
MSRWLKRALIGTGIGVGVVAIGVFIYAWYLYGSIKDTAKAVYEPIPSQEPYISKDPDVQPRGGDHVSNITDQHPFSVAILGVDQREHDVGRSDSIIVLAVNPVKNSILMFNIPRDTRTEIVGHGTVDKINHAYAFGGVEMSKQTIENFLDYPIDYYIKINMEGFAKLIDLMGGVEVQNPFSFDYGGRTFEKGPLKLNGNDTLLYSRMRYDDPRGDFGRNTRQRDVLVQVMKESLSFTNVMQVQTLLNQLGSSVKTNITFDEMKTFMADYRTELNHIDTVEVSGTGQTINGIWYYIVSDQEKTRIHQLMKDQMQQSTGGV